MKIGEQSRFACLLERVRPDFIGQHDQYFIAKIVSVHRKEKATLFSCGLRSVYLFEVEFDGQRHFVEVRHADFTKYKVGEEFQIGIQTSRYDPAKVKVTPWEKY